MRLDKYLAQLWVIPRRQTKKLLKSWEVRINDSIEQSPQRKIQEGDILSVYGEAIPVKFDVHLLVHKPAWYISSNVDEWPYTSYKDLLHDCPYSELVEIGWRLDQDTEGLLFCSSDGKVIHNIIHPHKKVRKSYYIETVHPLSDTMIQSLKAWITLEDGSTTRPAKATKRGAHALQLDITEGKFHQVKRMLKAVGNEVSYLRRDAIGPWKLEGIEKGAWTYVDIP